MKKLTVIIMCSVLISSCGSYEATGAYTGAQFGSVIGSAVGGLTGGWRGSDVGQLIGLAGGAAVGAAIGKAADNRAEQRLSQYNHRRQSSGNDAYSSSDSGYDPAGRGDDRIDFGSSNNAPLNSYAAGAVALDILNARFADADGDGLLRRGETARVTFEIRNGSSQPVFNVQPSVTELTGNRHVHVSENILVECIQPRQTIRYTAQVKADNGLRNGEAILRLTVLQGGRELTSGARQFRVATSKR